MLYDTEGWTVRTVYLSKIRKGVQEIMILIKKA